MAVVATDVEFGVLGEVRALVDRAFPPIVDEDLGDVQVLESRVDDGIALLEVGYAVYSGAGLHTGTPALLANLSMAMARGEDAAPLFAAAAERARTMAAAGMLRRIEGVAAARL